VVFVITTWSLACECHSFGEIYVRPRTTLKMKAVCATERTLSTYKCARCHIQGY